MRCANWKSRIRNIHKSSSFNLFGGFSDWNAAENLGANQAEVRRDWEFARAGSVISSIARA